MCVRRTNAFDALRTALRGAVLSPQDDGFQSACSPWNRAVRQRPAVVVRAAQPDDVVTAVRFAANQRPPIAVQAAGHGARIPADGALLVDTSALAGVEVDPAANCARIGAGARLVDVVLAALDSRRMSGQFWATPSAERDGAASPTISSIALPTAKHLRVDPDRRGRPRARRQLDKCRRKHPATTAVATTRSKGSLLEA